MVQQLRSIELEPGPRALEFLLSEADRGMSRENVVFAGGAAILPGMLVGLLTVDEAPDIAAAKTNGGDGTMALETPAVGSGLQAGAYRIVMTGGTFSASQAYVGTGDGVLTLGTPAFVPETVQVGDYTVVCIATDTDKGTFAVEDPDGRYLGAYTIGGAAFANQIKFSIADGSADFKAGDAFTITVEAAVAANGLSTFDVYDPSGAKLTPGVVGTKYDGPIKFTISDGSANFHVGDEFTVTVGTGALTYAPWNPDAVDGSQTIAGIAAYGYDTATNPADGVIIARMAQVKRDLLVWGTVDASLNADGKAAAEASLAALTIRVR